MTDAGEAQAFLYNAFTSCSRADERFARRLEAGLERYLAPKGALPGRRRPDPMSTASGTGRLASGAYVIRYQSEHGQDLLRFTLVR